MEAGITDRVWSIEEIAELLTLKESQNLA